MSENQNPKRQTAGLFDIRTIIGALLGIYGVVLLFVGLFDNSSSETAKSVGVNANLWVGLALIVVAAGFLVWAFTRPIVVDEEQLEADREAIDQEAARQREIRETEAGH